MSGFHGLFSVGGFIGAASMTSLHSIGFDEKISVLGCSLLMFGCMVCTCNGFPGSKISRQSAPLLVIPKGLVLTLALLASAMFLVEGAVLDWGHY